MLGNEEGRFWSAVVKWRICIQSMSETKTALVFICNPWLQLAWQMVVSFLLQPYFCWEGSGLHLMNMHIRVLSHLHFELFCGLTKLGRVSLSTRVLCVNGQREECGGECVQASSRKQPADAVQSGCAGCILVWEPHLEYCCVGWGESQLRGCGFLFFTSHLFSLPPPPHSPVGFWHFCTVRNHLRSFPMCPVTRLSVQQPVWQLGRD